MNSHIGLRQLRAFHTVMTTGNVTAAAQKLNLTQPAVSKQLTALEQSLGLTLFHRKRGATTSATPEGIEFFKSSEAAISGLLELPAIAQKIMTKSQSRLRIAATPPVINSSYMMQAIKELREEFQNIQVLFEARSRVDIENWVALRQVDIAIALLPSSVPGLSTHKLVDTSAVAVMASGHPLSERQSISPRDLAPHNIILPSRQLLRSRVEDSLKASSDALLPCMEASSALTCCQMAASGLGVAICDPFSPSLFPPSLLTVRAWRPNVPLTYGAIFPEGTDLNPPTARFLELLEKHCCEIHPSDKAEHSL